MNSTVSTFLGTTSRTTGALPVNIVRNDRVMKSSIIAPFDHCFASYLQMHLTKQQFELAIPILVQEDLTHVKCPWSSKANYYKHTTTSTSGIISNTTTNTTTTTTTKETPPRSKMLQNAPHQAAGGGG